MIEFARALPVEILQPPYHLFRRDIENEALPFSRENNIGVLVYGPLAHGLLTGTLTENTTFANDDWRSKSAVFTSDDHRHNLTVVRALENFAADRSMTVSQLPSPGRWRTRPRTWPSSVPGKSTTSRTALPPRPSP
jgi:aryl-alcohol dehydrogenase-like predicted oxidoreductase